MKFLESFIEGADFVGSLYPAVSITVMKEPEGYFLGPPISCNHLNLKELVRELKKIGVKLTKGDISAFKSLKDYSFHTVGLNGVVFAPFIYSTPGPLVTGSNPIQTQQNIASVNGDGESGAVSAGAPQGDASGASAGEG